MVKRLCTTTTREVKYRIPANTPSCLLIVFYMPVFEQKSKGKNSCILALPVSISIDGVLAQCCAPVRAGPLNILLFSGKDECLGSLEGDFEHVILKALLGH